MGKRRDCKTCIYRVPVWDENQGIWKTAECVKWDCEYVNRKEAAKAWKKLHEGTDSPRWEEHEVISCGKLLRNRTDIIEERCPKCKCYSIRLMYTNESKFCPHCGERIGL